jgi:pyridoxamine 5'-phosphate oxidase
MERLPPKLPDSPLPLILKWLEYARADGVIPNPDAMTLATADSTGRPSARIVLCKKIVPVPGYLVFYTNYGSPKARDIETGTPVAGVFHWDHLNRQVRVEGVAVRSPADESDAYFATRDKESQIGAWTSAQSQPLESRAALKDKHIATTRKLAELAAEAGKTEIPRPPFWGGYRIWLGAVELWVRGGSRLHDRGRWERNLSRSGDEITAGDWIATRLQP